MTPCELSTAKNKPREVRITQLQPAIDWSLVWGQSPERKIVWLSQVSMVHAGSWHNTHECEVAQNLADGQGQLYPVRQAGYHATSPHRMWGETEDLGKDPHTDRTDRRRTYTYGMTLSSLFPTVAPTKTSGDLVVLGEYGFLYGTSTQGPISNGLHWLHASDAM